MRTRCTAAHPATLAAMLLAACGGGSSPADGGADRTGGDGGSGTEPDIPWLVEGVPPIAPPAPPALVPCPAGWHEVVSESGVTTCDPYPPEGPAVCPRGQAHFPGETGCAPVGSPCPAGEFAEDLPDDGTVRYVLAGATGGDGSRARPFGRIGDALAVAMPGTTVALGRGRYEELASIRAGVTLAGACAEATVITYTGTDPRVAVLTATGAGVTVRNLSIEESDRLGISVSGPSAELLLEGVVVDAATGAGLLAFDGSRLQAVGLVVRDTLSAGGLNGRGLGVERGARADVSRALFEQNHEAGVFADGVGTIVVLTDVVVRDTLGRTIDGMFGRGIGIERGARAEVSRALFERNHERGLFAGDAGTTLLVTDVVVRDTRGQESDGLFGHGLGMQLGASVAVSRTLFEQNREVGVFGIHRGSVISLTDVVVRDSQPRESDGASGRGLEVQLGAHAEVSRMLVEHNRTAGVVAFDEGTRLTLSDVVVRDTQPEENGRAFGRGLEVQLGASAEVIRASFERNRELGVVAGHPGTAVSLTDVVVRDTQPQESDGRAGRGLNVQGGANVVVTRAIFERGHDIGIFVSSPGASVSLADVVVRDTQAQESDGRFGRGLEVQLGASAEVAATIFERNRDTGVHARNAGTVLSLTDVVVRDTAPRSCAESSCPEEPFGHDVVSVDGAVLTMARFIVGRASLCGLMLAEEGQIDLSAGEVAESPIGICLQVAGYPRARLTAGVVFRDVGRDIEGTAFAVPEPSDPTELTP